MKPSSMYSQIKGYLISMCLVQTPEDAFSAMKIAPMFSILAVIGIFTEIPELSRR
jgi:hypothetical protein